MSTGGFISVSAIVFGRLRGHSAVPGRFGVAAAFIRRCEHDADILERPGRQRFPVQRPARGRLPLGYPFSLEAGFFSGGIPHRKFAKSRVFRFSVFPLPLLGGRKRKTGPRGKRTCVGTITPSVARSCGCPILANQTARTPNFHRALHPGWKTLANTLVSRAGVS